VVSPALALAGVAVTDQLVFLGVVVAVVTGQFGAIRYIVNGLGARLDEQGRRLDRIEARLDTLHDVVADLAARVRALEERMGHP
jgi:hypothetical protein